MSLYHVVAMSSSEKDAFRLVTSQGTHILCKTMSSDCREVWLAAITAGMERSLSAGQEPVNLEVFKKVKPRSVNKRNLRRQPYCHSCGKMERLEFPLIKEGAPILQYGEEERVDISKNCYAAQGVVDHVNFVREMYRYQELDQYAMQQARCMVLQKLQPELEVGPVPLTAKVQLTNISKSQVFQLFVRPEFKACKRASSTLHDLVTEFEQGIIGVLEFLELMEQSLGIRDKEMAALKKQAFRIAGDMGTSLKMLAEQAVPFYDGSPQQYASTELLQCILDFLLDLCEDGEIQTIAFYWPQLCNIHLQMLPPTDAASLKRIELVEDFLLTVATKHSVNLAIELIWSHTADLEDAKTLKYCRKRKFAVVRFLCELESMLFHFESCWGGGSVTVSSHLNPTNHQMMLLKHGMAEIQRYRMMQTEVLSRSCRLDKLHKRCNEATLGPEKMAEEALRIAKNADYLSSHLAFTKRLCDIAEKLFAQPVPKRAMMLQEELFKINASGAMGGDPLNMVKDSHTRVVRIPPTEGHVFRSKERTPVLLLIEVNDEGITEEEAIGLNQQFKSEKLQQEKRNQEDDGGQNILTDETRSGDVTVESLGNGDFSSAEAPNQAVQSNKDAAESSNLPQEVTTDIPTPSSPKAATSPSTKAIITPGDNIMVDEPGSQEGLHHDMEQRRTLILYRMNC